MRPVKVVVSENLVLDLCITDIVLSKAYRSFVMDAMNGAFDIAEAGQKGFTAIAPQRAPVPAAQQIQPGTLSQGQTDAFNDAFSWLFDTVSSQNIDNIPQQDQQAIQDAQNEWNRLYG